MSARNVVALFGGQGGLYSEALAAHVSNKTNNDVQLLLSNCFDALQEEVGLLPAACRSLLPEGFNFLKSDWTHSSYPSAEDWGSAPLSTPLIFVTQLATLLHDCASTGFDKFLSQCVGTIGHSQGVASALVLSASTDVTSFVSLAREMTKALLWIGIGNQYYASKHPSARHTAAGATWMLSVLKLPLEVVNAHIVKINNTLSPVDRLQLALVNGSRAFSVVGPPPALQALHREIESREANAKVSFLPVHAPFHSPALKMTSSSVVSQLRARGLTGSTNTTCIKPNMLRIPVYSCENGEDMRHTTRDLVETFAELQLVRPVNWPRVLSELELAHSHCNIVDFGPRELNNFSPSLHLTGRLVQDTSGTFKVLSSMELGGASTGTVEQSSSGGAPISSAGAHVGGALAAEMLAMAPEMRITALTTIVSDVVADILGRADVPNSKPLMEAGMDSARSIRFAASLTEKLGGLPLSVTFLFNYTSVAAIVTHLAEQLDPRTRKVKGPSPRRALSEGLDETTLAVVGMAANYPGGSKTPKQFWENCCAGVEGVIEIPFERWDLDMNYDPNPLAEHKHYPRHGGFITDLEMFDPGYFGMSVTEARQSDPQQRMVLESTLAALASAGYTKEELPGQNFGVYVGTMCTDYRLDRLDGVFAQTGNCNGVVANRVSYTFGLKGPSLAVDTACSSALVALDMGCHHLIGHRCDVAVVSGVNILLPPTFIMSSTMGTLSTAGHSHSFDHRADGYARGEGVGTVVVKRIADAKADGDYIYGYVKAVAINQDGRSANLTSPNGLSQEECARKALEVAGEVGSDVTYVETHGTGTKLGDPIEFGALRAVLSENRPVDRPVVFGASKTTVGHLEGGSGTVSVIRGLMSLQHGVAPPNLHMQKINPHLNIEGFAAVFPKKVTPLTRIGNKPLLCGISSFGFGGTNGHCILEERILEPGETMKIVDSMDHLIQYNKSYIPWRVLKHPFLQLKNEEEGELAGYETLIGPRMRTMIDHHCVHGSPVFPAAAYMEMTSAVVRDLLAGAKTRKLRHATTVELSDIGFERACHLDGDNKLDPKAVTVKCSVSPEGWFELARCSNTEEDEGGSFVCVTGSYNVPAAGSVEKKVMDLDSLRSRCSAEFMKVTDFYRAQFAAGLQYSERFRAIKRVWKSENEALGLMQLAEDDTKFRHGFDVHPAMLDGAIQMMFHAVAREGEEFKPLLPFSVQKVTFFGPSGDRDMWAHVILTEVNEERTATTCDINLMDAAGNVCVSMEGLVSRYAEMGSMDASKGSKVAQSLFEVQWMEAAEVKAFSGSVGPTLVVGRSGELSTKLQELLGGAVTVVDVNQTASLESATELLTRQPWAAVFHMGAMEPGVSGVDVVDSMIRLWQALENQINANPEGAIPTVVVVTHTTQPVNDMRGVANPEFAGVWGAARTARLEIPSMKMLCVDVEGAMTPMVAKSVLAEFAAVDAGAAGASDVAIEVALTATGGRYTPHLVESKLWPDSAVDLHLKTRGALSNLTVVPMTADRQAPGRGEIEVRRHAVGLNFRDVLNVMDLYPGEVENPGTEFAGVVVAVGEGVTEFAEGDRVFANGMGMASYKTLGASHFRHIPEGLTFNDAAVIPTVFNTTMHCLSDMGVTLKRGETILIHAASGGVGLAAIQYAKYIGAKIIGTAGSQPKIDYLYAQGVDFVASSRDPARFLKEVTQFLGPNGKVDVVLNSLSNEFITHSVNLLAPNGRFAEIGKRDIWSKEQMAAVRPDVEYLVFALDHRLTEEPELCSLSSDRVVALFKSGDFKPLPTKAFPIQTELVDALRYLQQARQIGKVVVSMDDDVTKISGDGAYVITGGTGGLGLVTARWLMEGGAANVVLLSRSGRIANSDASRAEFARLQASRTNVVIMNCDVSQESDVVRMLSEVRAKYTSVRGIIHAAGVLDDGVLASQSRATVERVYGPKVNGAWHLHKHTQQDTLEMFVVYSSVISLFGGAGQVNYAAANSCLDALCHHRLANGLPGVSIQWGPWAEVGMAANLADRFESMGMKAISQALGAAMMAAVSGSSVGQVGASSMVWQKYLQQFQTIPPLFTDIAAQHLKVEAKVVGEEWVTELLGDATTQEEVKAKLLGLVKEVAHESLGRAVAVDKPLAEAGIDSLSSVEFRNALSNRLAGKRLAVSLIFDYPTIEAITNHLAQELSSVFKSALSGDSGAGASSAIVNPSAGLAVGNALSSDPIVIVGMAMRFPGDLDCPTTMWNGLVNGTNGVVRVPFERWDVDREYHPSKVGKSHARHGGFVSKAHLFDPAFFGVSAQEASQMDPHQRQMLEVGYEALFMAGYTKETLVGSDTGVFLGQASIDAMVENKKNQDGAGAFTATGRAAAITANRFSYILGLRGPSLAVDTACSSAMVAMDVAVRQLQHHRCGAALVAGVNFLLGLGVYNLLGAAGMLSPTGSCKTFDDSADGYVRGEGAGGVVLKRMSDAVAAGDKILAVVKGVAINQDGRTASLTAPNGPSQQRVISDALNEAGATGSDVSYVECHGTGTALGDPIEFEALKAVMAPNRPEDKPLVLGAIKSNIGHLEAASGIAGIIKTVLVLQHGAAPPNLHLKTLNQHLYTDGFPVKFLREDGGVMPLSRISGRGGRMNKLLAGVSSFGFGGTNGHVVLQEASTAEELSGTPVAEDGTAQAHKVAFLFTGQGSQYVDMGYNLYHSDDKAFREAMDECDRVLRPLLPVPLLDVIFSRNWNGRNLDGLVNETQYSQPALFSIEYSLAQSWKARGVVPDVVMGHSVGEYAAAVMAGVMSLEDALWVVVARGQLLGQQPKRDGIMVSLRASEEEVIAAMAEKERAEGPAFRNLCGLAAMNGPKSTVLAGDATVVRDVVGRMSVPNKELAVSHAFHSPLVAPALPAFNEALKAAQLNAPGGPGRPVLISNVTGKVAGPEVATVDYWCRHIVQAVRFFDGVQAVLGEGTTILMELGPQAVLSKMGRQCVPRGDNTPNLTWLTSLSKAEDNTETMGAAEEKLVKLLRLHGDVEPQVGRGGLVKYNRSVFWGNIYAHPFKHPFAQQPTGVGMRTFEVPIGPRVMDMLSDFQLHGLTTFPPSSYIEMAAAAARVLKGGAERAQQRRQPVTLTDITFDKQCMLEMGEEESATAGVSLRCEVEQDGGFVISKLVEGEGSEQLLVGTVAPATSDEAGKMDYAAVRARCGDVPGDIQCRYNSMRRKGMHYGPRFQTIKSLFVGDGEAVGELEMHAQDVRFEHGFDFHPALMEGVFSMLGFARDDLRIVLRPLSLEKVVVFPTASEESPQKLWVHSELQATCPNSACLLGDVTVADEAGNIVMKFTGLRMTWHSGMHPLLLQEQRFRDGGKMYEVALRGGLMESAYKDHVVGGQLVMPGASFIEMAAAATRHHMQSPEVSLTNIKFMNPLVVPDGDDSKVLKCEVEAAGGFTIATTSAGSKEPVMHAMGSYSAAPSYPPSQPTYFDLRAAQQRCHQAVDRSAMYSEVWMRGLMLGKHFQTVSQVWTSADGREALGRLTDRSDGAAYFSAHPCVLDGAQQTSYALTLGKTEGNPLFIPASIDRFMVNAPLNNSQADGLWSHIEQLESTLETLVLNVTLIDDAGVVRARIERLACAPAPFSSSMAGGSLVYDTVLNQTPVDKQLPVAVDPSPKRVLMLAEAAVSRDELTSLKGALADSLGGRTEIKVVSHNTECDLGNPSEVDALLVENWSAVVVMYSAKNQFMSFMEGEEMDVGKVERLLVLCQSLGRLNRAINVVLVTSDCPVGSSSGSCISDVGVWGFARSARKELWNQGVRLVSLDSAETNPAILASQIKAEMFYDSNPSAAPEVVYQGGSRFTPKMQLAPARRMYPVSALTQSVNPEGSYIVTGGLGGLGLVTANTLQFMGARSIVLVSRSGRIPYQGQGLEKLLDELQNSRADVHIMKCDMSNEQQVSEMLQRVRDLGKPLSGVVHSAGVLRDGVLQSQTPKSLRTVVDAKATGAWYLHKHTQYDDMRMFVMYSSVSGHMGNEGQTNYSAANTYLDALCTWRRNSGLSGLSIGWPAISGVGMAVAAGVEELLRGLSIPTDLVSDVLRRACVSPSSVITVLPSTGLLASFSGPWLEGLVENVKKPEAESASTAASGSASCAKLSQAVAGMSPQESGEFITNVVVTSVRKVMLEEVGPNESLMGAGLSSLDAIELGKVLGGEIGATLSAMFVFNYPTINAMVSHLRQLVAGSEDGEGEEDRGTGVVNDEDGDVAIVGIATRLPGGVTTPADMWSMMREGRDAFDGPVPLSRWDMDGLDHKDQVNAVLQARRRRGAFLEDAEMFDEKFFNVSRAEVAAMDPQQRLLVEVGYEALHDAGEDKESLNGSNTGVFVGISSMDFYELQAGQEKSSVFAATGSSHSVAAGRVSYLLGLQGPCSAYDTACSSSLVALHSARRALQHGECKLALVEGVNLMLTSTISCAFAKANMTSPTGACHTFDASADGYMRGEAATAVVLKRLSEARAAGDLIYAVIKGSAVAQDGQSASLTAPNGQAQQALIRQALREARLKPSDVGYLEAHGTGTSLGDPIEIGAAAAVLGSGRGRGRVDNPLVVGSIKGNIGHSEPSAGLTGLIAATLVLQRGEAPPNAQLKTLNPQVEAAASVADVQFPTVPTRLLPPVGGRLVAGVSSFGYAGTICHVVLQQAPRDLARPVVLKQPRPALVLNRSSFPWAELPHPFRQHAGKNYSGFDNLVGETMLGRVADQSVFGHTVFPAAGFLEMAAASVRQLSGPSTRLEQAQQTVLLSDVTLNQTCVVPKDARTVLNCEVDPSGWFEVSCHGEGSQGGVVVAGSVGSGSPLPSVNLSGARSRCHLSAGDIRSRYESLRSAGVACGPALQTVQDVWMSSNRREAVAKVVLPSTAVHGYDVHPALLGGALHVLSWLTAPSAGAARALHPTSVSKVTMQGACGGEAWVLVNVVGEPGEQVESNIQLVSADGTTLVSLEGVVMTTTTQATVLAVGASVSGRSRSTGRVDNSFARPEAKVITAEMVRDVLKRVSTSTLGWEPSPTEDLTQSGVDSLLAVDFRNALEEQLGGLELPPDLVFQHPSSGAISKFILDKYEGVTPSKSSSTAMMSSNAGSAPTRMRLFVFAPGTGTCAAFYQAAKNVEAGVEVVFMDLPGSLTRRNETPISNPKALVEKLYIEVSGRLTTGSNTPFAFVGYSFGCMTSYHVAQMLSDRLDMSPSRMCFIDLPPQLSASELAQFKRASELVPGLKYMPHVGDMLEAWFAAGLTRRVTCPISCFGGQQSLVGGPQQLGRWRALGEAGMGEVRVRMYAGDHWTISDQFNEVMRDICEDVGVGYVMMHQERVGGGGGKQESWLNVGGHMNKTPEVTTDVSSYFLVG